MIEEDGKTEEEFIAQILDMNTELLTRNRAAEDLSKVISHNLAAVTGDE